MSVATLHRAVVTHAWHERPLGRCEAVTRLSVAVDGEDAERMFQASGDAAYRLRRHLLAVTGKGRWLQVPGSSVTVVLVDGEVDELRAAEVAS